MPTVYVGAFEQKYMIYCKSPWRFATFLETFVSNLIFFVFLLKFIVYVNVQFHFSHKLSRLSLPGIFEHIPWAAQAHFCYRCFLDNN